MSVKSDIRRLEFMLCGDGDDRERFCKCRVDYAEIMRILSGDGDPNTCPKCGKRYEIEVRFTGSERDDGQDSL